MVAVDGFCFLNGGAKTPPSSSPAVLGQNHIAMMIVRQPSIMARVTIPPMTAAAVLGFGTLIKALP